MTDVLKFEYVKPQKFKYGTTIVLFTMIKNILRTQFWVRKRLVIKG